LICAFDYAMEHFDSLTWCNPGLVFLCGLDRVEGELRPAFADLIQYDGCETLTAVLPGS
jgi:hypothetical protein